MRKATCPSHYCDECTPGNPLQPDPSRKLYLFYFAPNLKAAIRSEWSWWTVGAIRTQKVKLVRGGLGQVTAKLLGSMEENFHGIGLTLQGQPKFVRIRIASFIADESGLHMMLGCKGASGRRPCFRCQRLVSKQCVKQLGDRMDSAGFFPLWHPSLDDLTQNTNADILGAIDTLQRDAPRMNKKNKEELEKKSRMECTRPWAVVQHVCA